MFFQVAFDLPLGLYNKPEAGPVANGRGQHADGEGTAVPNWIQQARTRIKLLQTRCAPGQVISFLVRGFQQQTARRSSPGYERLAVVQGLGGDLSGVVDPHESSGLSPVRFGQRGRGYRRRLPEGGRSIRNGSGSVSGSENRA